VGAFGGRAAAARLSGLRCRASWHPPCDRYHAPVLPPDDLTLTGADATLMASRLQEIRVDQEACLVWFQDPATGDTWLMDHLVGDQHGGGVPRIRSVPRIRRMPVGHGAGVEDGGSGESCG